MAERIKIRIETEYIKLGALLKFAGLAGDGSMAKALIAQGNVKFNGEIETRRGKKVRPGDIVEACGRIVDII